MNEYQNIMDIGAGMALTVAGWLLRELWGAVKELQRDISKLEASLLKEYVLKDDLDKRAAHIEDMFQRIYDKLDGKGEWLFY
jgi:hypothetical protein